MSAEGDTEQTHVVVVLVADRYQIVRWLGGGGMGRVYEAIDTELDERIALKVLRGNLSDEAVERFRREVRLTRRIQHPNVARMFDIGEHAGDRFLTMELVDGDSLAAKLGTPMAWSRLQPLAVQLCAGLAAAHDRGVIHRDLKPDNILVERGTERVVITDFGIARGADDASVTQVGMVVGTPRYMAPEQLAGTAIDGRADLFSLGVLLFELASGMRPWPGDNAIAIAVAQATHAKPRLSAHVPAAFATLVEALLEQDPERRPATAAELGAAIARLSEVAPAVAREPHTAVAPAVAPRESTIAVLPFACAPADDYIADGVRQDLIDTLSTTPMLRVRPAGAFDGTQIDPRTAGRELGVDHVVLGSVRRTPDLLLVAARMISVADGFQVWAHRVECRDDEILSVSDQLGQAIARALSTRANQQAPLDPRAVELYLRARAELRRFWGDHAETAADLLEQAAAISPDSPQITSGLACAAVMAWVRQNKAELLPRARRWVARALALDLPEGYLASSALRINTGDFVGGAAELRIALDRNAMSALAHEIAGRLLLEIDPGPAARQHFETAIGLDPSRAQLLGTDLARLAWIAGDRATSDHHLAVLAADPDPGLQQLSAMAEARLALWDRDLPRVFAAFSRSRIRIPVKAMQLFDQVRLWRDGKPFDDAAWHGVISALAAPDRPNRLPLVALQRAIEIAMLVGQPDHAIDALRVAATVGLVDIVWLDACPLFAGADADPRWRSLREEVATRARRMLAVLRA